MSDACTTAVNNRAAVIAAFNDGFRRTLQAGRFHLTRGVASLPADALTRLLVAVQNFNAFDSDDDPYGEHDVGAISQDGTRYFFKIEYFDPSLEYGSDDSADPVKTYRVLTILRADEY